MLIKTEEFQKICSLILGSIESNELSTLTETLELKTSGKVLYLNVTNKEYYTSVKFNLDHEEDLHATVNANLFLKLISQITKENIEITCMDTYVLLKGNGEYKIPLVFDNDKLLELPVITIDNPNVEMNISGDILQTIMNFNSKELLRGTIAQAVQRMFYIDQEGCITFTSGACVNNFQLEKPIKILLNERTVKLFKLFKNSMVKFTLGHDAINDSTIIQTKVRFETENISLTVITGCDDSLVNSVPASAIRQRANAQYPNQVVLNREGLLQAINRLLLFSAGYGSKENIKPYSSFEFDQDRVVIYDSDKNNYEVEMYENNTSVSEPYSVMLDLADFKMVLDNCTEDYITLKFGNPQCVVISRGQISNVIATVKTAGNN